MPSRVRTTRATMSASVRVEPIVCSSRALAIARAMARAWCSSPSVAMMAAKLALARGGDDIGGARTALAHTHVERPVEPEGKAALGFIELHRRNAEVEDDAIGRRRIAGGQNGF